MRIEILLKLVMKSINGLTEEPTDRQTESCITSYVDALMKGRTYFPFEANSFRWWCCFGLLVRRCGISSFFAFFFLHFLKIGAVLVYCIGEWRMEMHRENLK